MNEQRLTHLTTILPMLVLGPGFSGFSRPKPNSSLGSGWARGFQAQAQPSLSRAGPGRAGYSPAQIQAYP